MLHLAASDAVLDVLIYLGVIVAAAVVLGVVMLVLRKRLGHRPDPSFGLGFTLAELDELHAAGQLTDEQYHRLRSRVAQRGAGTLSGQPGVEPTTPLTPENPAAPTAEQAADPEPSTDLPHDRDADTGEDDEDSPPDSDKSDGDDPQPPPDEKSRPDR